MRFSFSIVISYLLFGYCMLAAVGYRPVFVHINRALLWWWGDDFLHARAILQAALPFSDLLIYNLPGACWIALLTWMGLGLGQRLAFPFNYLYLFPFLLGQGMELLQYLGLSDGTFDWVDALLNTFGFLLGYWWYQASPLGETQQLERVPPWQLVTYGLLLFSVFLVDV